jgi:hypothetical protein
MIEKIKILERILEDWLEVYINGTLIYDGDDKDILHNKLALAIIKWFDSNVQSIEIRKFVSDFKYDEKDEEYNAPSYVMTGKDYWEDWEKAEQIYPLG